MEKRVRITSVELQARVFLAASILIIYCITVVAVILAIEHFQASLFNGEYDTFPNLLLLAVWFLYYAAPVGLAVVFGLLFRPFWPNVRNIFFSILAAQFLYSFTVGMLRWDYLKKFDESNRWRKNDKVKILEMDPKHYDLNEDGFLDQISISPVFDFTKIRPSEYTMDAMLVPADSAAKWTGKMDAPFTIDGGGVFTVSERGAKNKIVKDFTIRPRTDLGSDVHLYVDTDFKIKFLLRRIVTVDDQGKKLLRFTRWAPYLRTTGWEGSDPKIYGDWILLDTMIAPDIFTLRGPEI